MDDHQGRNWKLHVGDCREVLAQMPEQSVQCCVTSPPYFNLRSYGGGELEIGSETTPDEFVAAMLAVFGGEDNPVGVWRVLRDDGILWVNLGDSYAGGGGFSPDAPTSRTSKSGKYGGLGALKSGGIKPGGDIKAKDLMGIPWRVALALQAAGWYLRDAVIWCLAGGTSVYARVQKGDMPMMIKDLVRLDPATVKLWNGEKWTQVLGWGRSTDESTPLAITLRSGEKLRCTAGHLWPTQRGNVRADEIKAGDVIQTTTLPEPDAPLDTDILGEDLAWMIGLYIAEGSRLGDKGICLAGHTNENQARTSRMRGCVERFGGTITAASCRNRGTIRIYSRILLAAVDEYVHGKNAKTKGVRVKAWRHSNAWLKSLLMGYLAGDGHHDTKNNRWRLGFTNNARLAADMRTLAARVGARLTLKKATGTGFGREWPIYRGEIRFDTTEHHNAKSRSEVMSVDHGWSGKYWDVAVADSPNVFALASGVLTHNCKPSPMPGSQKDRCTSAYEFIFQLTKQPRYFFDMDAIAEKATCKRMPGRKVQETHHYGNGNGGNTGLSNVLQRYHDGTAPTTRTPRNVWTIPHEGFSGAHFATFPSALPAKCIKASTSEKGCCPECGAPWVRQTESTRVPTRPGNNNTSDETGMANRDEKRHVTETRTTGWEPGCECTVGEGKFTPNPTPCTVLDCFSGSGTSGKVAVELGRQYVGIELNPEYAEMATHRITNPQKHAPKNHKKTTPLPGQLDMFPE